MSKVCAIIPNYCHAQFLELRINSILNQTYKDLDIIILDDASTDDSQNIIKNYEDRDNVSIIINNKNSGSVFEQWELGIRQTDSEYVWIAESDDWAESNFLDSLVPVLEENSDIALVYCQSSLANLESKITGNAKCWTDDLDRKRWESNYINEGNQEIEKFLSIKNTIPNASAVLQRRSAIEKCLPINKSLKLCGDWLHWIKMVENRKLAYLSESLNNWRLSSSNVRSEPPGIIEWEEGQAVFDEIGRVLEISDYEFLNRKYEFLLKCFGWLSEYKRAN